MAMRHTTYESAHMQSKRSYLTMDANALCSITFAVASLIGVQKHKCCNRMFLYAVLGCIAFILPAPHVTTNGYETATMDAVQKAFLSYAIAFLLGGVLVVVSKNGSGLLPDTAAA